MTNENFDIEASYEAAVQPFLDDLKGKIYYKKSSNYRMVFIADAKLTNDSKKFFKLKLLINESVVTTYYPSFEKLRKDLKTPSEYQEKLPVIEALKKGRESLKKASSAPKAIIYNNGIRYR